MDEDDGREDDGPDTYRLGPDGTPVDSGPDREPPEPETAAEHRQAGRRALGDGNYGATLRHLDRAVELATAAGDDELAAGALTDRGNVRLARADGTDGAPRAAPAPAEVREAIEAAVDDYTAAIERHPSGKAYFNRGLARARLGDRDASTADLERAAERGEGHPFLVRGNAYAEAGADGAAREDFTRAIERTGAAAARFNRGNANRRLGDRDAAIADYEAALDRASDLPDGGLRVLVELAGTTEGEDAAAHRIRAAFLAVAGRDVWRGVDLAGVALAEAPESSRPWVDAAALVLAGDALRGAAGYGPDDAIDADTERLHRLLTEGTIPAPTAGLVEVATEEPDTGTDAFDDVAAPDDLAAAVEARDDATLRAAAVSEFGRQLQPYQ